MIEMLESTYRDYIVGAYAVTIILLAGLIVWNVRRSVITKKRWDAIKSELTAADKSSD